MKERSLLERKHMHNLFISLFILAVTLTNLSPASATVINISAQTAYNFLDPASSTYIADAYLLDVRTPEEWLGVGHPGESSLGVGAFLDEPVRKVVNIPFLIIDKGKAVMNSNFVAEVNHEFAHDDYLLVICAGGSRSLPAAEALSAAGFTHIYNVNKGFSGDWVGAGLPYNHSTVGMFTPAAVPEPGTLVLLGSGLLGVTFCRRRNSS